MENIQKFFRPKNIPERRCELEREDLLTYINNIEKFFDLLIACFEGMQKIKIDLKERNYNNEKEKLFLKIFSKLKISVPDLFQINFMHKKKVYGFINGPEYFFVDLVKIWKKFDDWKTMMLHNQDEETTKLLNECFNKYFQVKDKEFKVYAAILSNYKKDFFE